MSILLVVLVLVTVSLWVLIVGPRWGSLLAVPAVVTGLSVLVLVTLTVTPLLGVAFGLAVMAVLGAASAAGLVLILRRRTGIRPPTAAALALWLPASLGAVIWIGVRIAATMVPGASQLSWAMEGDATNNLNYTRTIIADNGIALGGAANPVPIPVAAVAIPESLDGLWGTGGSALAAHLAAYGWVWTAMLATGCVVMGAVAASLVDPRRRALVVVASAGGSLLPLTWFVGGVPIEFGYFNMPFALVLALASWLTFVASSRAPLVALVTEVGIATLLLLTWSPVLLIPVALGVLIAARHRRLIVGARGLTLAGSLGAVALFLAYAGLLTIPTFLVQSSALTAPGQGLPQSWMLALALVAVCLAAGAYLRSRLTIPVFGGVLALVAACYLAMALFLFISREMFDPWTAYYTVKLLWLVTAVLLPIGLSLVAAVGSTVRPRVLALATVSVAAALAVAVAAAAPIARPGAAVHQPAARILGGDVWKTGDDAVRIIVELAARGDSAILWESSSPDEEGVNFWAAYTTGDVDRDDRPLRRFAFREYGAFRGGSPGGAASANALCQLIRDPDRSMVIYTDNPALEEEFTANCTGSSADYRVGQTPGVDY
jgi:hypothetical protein